MKLLEWHEVKEPGYYWIFHKSDKNLEVYAVGEFWEARMYTPASEQGYEMTAHEDFKYYVKLDFPKAELAKLVAEKEAK